MHIVVFTSIAVIAALGCHGLSPVGNGRIDLTLMEAGASAIGLETAIIFVREEEQNRIQKRLYDTVVPHLIAALFEAQSVQEELDLMGIQEGAALSRMIERLDQAVHGIEFIADLEEIDADAP